MPLFSRYIGIDYSGAETPTSSLKGLRVYLAESEQPPFEAPPPRSPAVFTTKIDPTYRVYREIQTRELRLGRDGWDILNPIRGSFLRCSTCSFPVLAGELLHRSMAQSAGLERPTAGSTGGCTRSR
jgi:hypothetical protein